MSKVDVLNLEWVAFPSRDRVMATLVCNYLRIMGYSVHEGSIFDGYSLLNKMKPKIFFICDTRGAYINFELMRYAKRRGIIGASLISEGNFITSNIEVVDQFIWGWNDGKVLYEDINMQWTERIREVMLARFPELEGHIKVSGGVGFDVYKISSNHMGKKLLLNKYNKRIYDKVIGLGCWDFGVFHTEDPRYSIIRQSYLAEDTKRFIEDQKKFNEFMKDIVSANKDILFLFKEHPGCLGGRKASGIDGLDLLPNVIILKNEESIADCINASDFWLVYESTTALEAWLLGKQTALINPSGTDFVRANVYEGSPNYRSTDLLQNAIDAFYISGKLSGFDELNNKRKQIIQDTIQWDDGLNHVRAGNEIISLLENSQEIKLRKESFQDRIMRYKQSIAWNLLPYLSHIKRFKVYKERRKNFNEEELARFQKQMMCSQESFYKAKNFDKDELRQIRCI